MFKQENTIWVYLIGIVIMFGIVVIIGKDFFIPIIFGRSSVTLNQSFNSAPSMEMDLAKNYLAKIATNYGSFTIDLYEKNTPRNANNFAHLAKNGYYDRTKFHRMITDFLIQGGDRNTLNDNIADDGKGRAGYFIDDEVNWNSLSLSEDKKSQLTNLGYKSNDNLESKPLERYSLVMANNGPNTNSSQFFIVIAKADDPRISELNGRFTVIGKVISGTEILDKITAIEVEEPDSNAPRPSQEIRIENIEVYTR